MLRYAITDRTQYAENEADRRTALVAQAARLAAEGVDYIQLREKDLPAQDLIGIAREILSAIRTANSGTRLLINSRADVAMAAGAAGAAGVHLPSGEDQLTPRQIRPLFSHATLPRRHSDSEPREGEESPYFARPGTLPIIVSVSCHILDEVLRAKNDGADLILFGPIFGKSIAGKLVVPELGLAALETACKAAGDTPVLAIGGVTIANIPDCIAAGARGIAAIRLFL